MQIEGHLSHNVSIVMLMTVFLFERETHYTICHSYKSFSHSSATNSALTCSTCH